MRFSLRGADPPPGVPGSAGGLTRSWVLGAAASLVATAALFLPLREGVPRATDLPDHLGTTAQVLASMRHGDLYPRWLPDFHDGMGEPTLVFYPPGLYLIAAGLAWLAGSDVLFGLFTALVLFAFAGSLGMFAFLRRRFGDLAGVCGALLFAALPYRIFEVYAAGLDSAFAAGCLLPWVFAALSSESEREGAWPRFRLPLLFAAVVLLNLPTAVLLSYLAAIWLAIEIAAARRWSLARRVLLGLAGGMLIAGVYLVPAILELPEIQMPRDTLRGPASARGVYTTNFLFQGGGSWMTSGLRSMFDRMAIFPTIALVFGSSILWLVARRDPRAWPVQSRRLILSVGTVSFFLMTPISLPLWRVLPVLRQVNLPWRLLEPLGAMSVAVTASALAVLLVERAVPIPVRVAGILGILAVVSLWGVFASSISEVNGKVSAESVRASIGQYSRKPGYHLTPGARPIADLGRVPLLACDRPCRVSILDWSATRRRFDVDAPSGTQLAVRSYFFPGWSARSAGNVSFPLATYAEPGTGRIVIRVPPGRSEIRLRFGTVAARVFGWCISIAALAGMALLRIRKQRFVSGRGFEIPEDPRRALPQSP